MGGAPLQPSVFHGGYLVIDGGGAGEAQQLLV